MASLDDESEDTTSAQLGPPASLAREDEEDAERTLRQRAQLVGSSSAAPTLPPSTLQGKKGVDLEDSVEEETATAVARPAVNMAGVTRPGSVKFLTVERDELLDDTEVRTRPGQQLLDVPITLRAAATEPRTLPRPAAGTPASAHPPSFDVDAVPSDAATTLPLARSLPLLDGYANDGDDDVTKRAAGPGSVTEDSVTTKAAPVSDELVAAVMASARGPAPTLDDVTERTTSKRRLERPPSILGPGSDTQSESTQKPGALTNILRAIASELDSEEIVCVEHDDDDDDDDDEPAQNRTAVMASAPVQQPDGFASGSGSVGRLAPLAHESVARAHIPLPILARPGSDSGLRIAAHADGRVSGFERLETPVGSVDPRPAFADLTPPVVASAPPAPAASYGLVVGMVAVLALLVPVAVFVLLSARTPETPPSPGTRAEAASELQQHDATPRGKFDKKAMTAPSASSPAKPGARPPGRH